MVADDRLTKYLLWRACEPTGTALLVNSLTTARRIACFLSSMVSALARGECQLQYRQRDLVVQVQAASRRRDPAVAALDEAVPDEPAELGVEARGRRHALHRPEAEHQRLGGRLARFELFPVGASCGRGGDVLPRPGDVPPAPGLRSIGRIAVRARAAAVDRTAAPVGTVVTRFEPGARPARHLVAAKPGGVELAAGGVQLVPRDVLFDLGHLAGGAPPVEQGSLLDREAVRRDVVGRELRGPA